jgi:PAS domain S-box-containing protein/putative nucleotidyltransferase with HDIG domain
MTRQKTRSDQADALRRQAEEKAFRMMVEAVQDYAVIILDVEGRITGWNRGAEHIKGYRADEIVGRRFSQLYPKEDVESGKPERALAAAAAEGRFEDEGWRVRKDGSRFFASVIITVLRDDAGELRGFAKVTRDITTRKQVETTALESKAKLEAALASMTDAVCISDVTGQLTDFNNAFASFFRYRDKAECARMRSDNPGIIEVFMTNGELVPPDMWAVPRALRGETVTNAEYIFRRKDTGETWSGSCNFNPIRDKAGVIVGSVVVSNDITRRNKMEQEVREAKLFLELIVKSSPMPIIVRDAQANVTAWNPAAEKLLGWTEQEVLGKQPPMIPSEEQDEFVKTFSSVLKGNSTFLVDVTLCRKDGSIVLCEIAASFFQGAQPEKHGIIAIINDTSERKRAEEDVRQLLTQVNRRAKNLEALRAIDNAVLNSLDIDLTMSLILAQVQARLKVDATDILLLNPHSHVLTFAAGRGFHTEALKKTRLRLGEGFAGRSALERQIVNIRDLRTTGDAFMRTPLLKGEDFVTYFAAPLIAKGQVKGVLEVFHRVALAPDEEWLAFLRLLAGQTAIAIDNAILFSDLERSNVDLSLAYDATIEGWVTALDLRDEETQGHSRRVTEMTEKLAGAMGFSEADLVHVRRGALLHDIGKLSIPDAILLKMGTLTEEEWVIIRRHPQLAFDMLSPIAYLRPALNIPHCHHEKFDGSGYPQGLKGEQIPLAARIFAVIDVYDALTSARHYRAAWSQEKTLEHIKSLTGTHFDPQVVTSFLSVILSFDE